MQGKHSAYHQVCLFTFRFVIHVTKNVYSFQDVLWQQNNPPNPADAAIGPQIYDHHLYYRFAHVYLRITAHLTMSPRSFGVC